jgi:hypothetical protein
MNDTDRDPTSAPEEPEEERQGDDVDILKEFSALGQQLGSALKDVWDSDERKKIEKEIVKGMQIAGDEVRSFAKDVKAGKATEEIKQGAGIVGKDVRKGILGGLRMLNKELRRNRGKSNRGGDED